MPPIARASLIVFLVCVALVTPLLAQDGTDPAPVTPQPWTVDAIIDAPGAFGWTLSRDGTQGFWFTRTANREKDRFDLTWMLLDVATAQSRPLTTGPAQVSSPLFTPDGSALLYLSSADLPEGFGGPSGDEAGPQLWRLDLGGGEPRPLTKIPFGIRSFEWLEDGSENGGSAEGTIVYASRGPHTLRERTAKKTNDDTIVVEDPDEFAEPTGALYRLDLATMESVRIIEPDFGPIEDASISPDGRFAITAHGQDPSQEAEGKWPSRWFLRDLREGTITELFADRKSKPYGAAWSRDGSEAYLLWPRSTIDGEDMAAVRELRILDPRTGVITEFPLDWERGLAGGIGTITADGLITHLADGVKPRLARYTKSAQGWTRTWIEGGDRGGLYSFTAARDAKTCLIATGDASTPTRVHLGTLDGSTLTIGEEVWSQGFAPQPKARTEIIRWTGALGEEVEGIAFFPPDHEPGDRAPIIAMTHGGPHGADYDRFDANWGSAPHLYAERGAVVLMTNYHGSSDYGLAFGESIRAKYYELEIEDILSGIQHLVDRGDADPQRVGLIGWSNGAILSIATLTHRHKYAASYDFNFTACAPGAGDVNWTSDYGNCAFGGTFDDYYLGGPPWELVDLYIEKSPLFEVERVTTPTLIFFGTEDTAVPTSQGWEWYRALHSVGKAPVRFLLFPGEPHGLRKPSHQARKLAEEVAWFDQYFFEKPLAPPEPPEGSPIELARKERDIARGPHGRLGVMVDGALVPETIPFGNPQDDGTRLEVTRFEVTVDQWRAWDERFAHGVPVELRNRADHPATALHADAVRHYLAWLAEKTGATWRLPNADEWETLERSAGPLENTLDRWTGFAPSPVDQPDLQAMVRALGIDLALHPAGSHPPGRLGKGERAELIYDLGGNAAEWVRGKDGKLVARGGWTLESPDPYAPEDARPVVPNEYVGLRLVKVVSKRKRAVF